MIRKTLLTASLATLLLCSVLIAAGPPAPVASSPGGRLAVETVGSVCPTFSWATVPGTTRQTVAVFELTPEGELGRKILEESLDPGVSSWTPSLRRALTRGVAYAWAVGAEKGRAEVSWSVPLVFRVSAASDKEELAQALLLVGEYLEGRGDAPIEELAAAFVKPELEAGEATATARSEPQPAALGGSDFSIDASGNVAGLSFAGDGAGLTGVTAADVVCTDCVSEGELDFDAAPADHTHAGEQIVAGAVDEAWIDPDIARDSEIDADIASHAMVSEAHHAPTIDTTCTVTDNGDGTTTISCPDGDPVTLPVDPSCSATDNGDGTATVSCFDGSSVTWRLREIYLTDVSAGAYHSCGVRPDGPISCWGGAYDPSKNLGQDTPPNGTFTQIASGGYHGCGLRDNLRISCWGANGYGQSTPPTGAFLQVAVGDFHSCGVQGAQTVACWGQNTIGQAAPPGGTFSKVSAGAAHTCGLRSDATVACWGWNNWGQSSPPSGTFTDVSAGTTHTCGVRTDETVACWGSNTDDKSTPPSGSFFRVSVGEDHSCGIQTDGLLACWGLSDNGRSSPPSGTFEYLSTGSGHSCAIRNDGATMCWGDGDEYQTTVPLGLQ